MWGEGRLLSSQSSASLVASFAQCHSRLLKQNQTAELCNKLGNCCVTLSVVQFVLGSFDFHHFSNLSSGKNPALVYYTPPPRPAVQEKEVRAKQTGNTFGQPRFSAAALDSGQFHIYLVSDSWSEHYQQAIPCYFHGCPLGIPKPAGSLGGRWEKSKGICSVVYLTINYRWH